MYDYFCAKCFNIVWDWKYEYNKCGIKKYFRFKGEDYDINKQKEIYCNKCMREIGMSYPNICIKCFGDKNIVGDKKNCDEWFRKYKMSQYSIDETKECNLCKGTDFRIENQSWFSTQSTFKKENK